MRVFGEVVGEVRFTELRRRLPGISQKMLSATLRSLVVDGLIFRRVEDAVPPQVFYRLTDLGRSLKDPLTALWDWADDNALEVEANQSERQTAGGRPGHVRAGSRRSAEYSLSNVRNIAESMYLDGD
ncbi:winged helix-turn-helix transcriptional regulator [Lentzea sp. NPDC060358]|uniref:winged helix-turn-helix transcriptional regulator n=1 Tax=Lentzea sp. NPDC060358 TaxID=3347103 RepID=UPI0036638EFD